WGDVTPIKKNQLTLPADYTTFQSPSVEYRGIFLNDEDWSLQPWSWKNFEPSDTKGRIGARTYKEIFKLLMRLRANAIWPGMHGITTPFYFVPGAKEAADSCGIVIGTSHCEPLMRNNVGEWKVSERGEYNYITNRESVQSYWTERLKEAGRYENFYTIGMRGIHDSGMEGVKTLQEKTDALQQVINDQRTLLSKYVKKDVAKIPQAFVPYKEVLQIMENGLQVPDDITLIWCDDNYGYMTRLSDQEQQKRSGGAGVYYHLSYWGRPHDYMWLCTTQPGLVYSEMKQAYDCNARRLWIVNVHDLKPAAYDLELFLDMAWDINSVSPSTLVQHQKNWLCREFGTEAGEKLLPAMLEFYRLCGIRKPEFMGWNQVELDKKKYIKGWSPIKNTDFSLTEFGGELDRYLESYESIKRILSEVEPIIPQERKDAFFAQIKYPVFGAAAMSTKMLEAQRARCIFPGSCDTNLWTRESQLMNACAKSIKAYQEIRDLTDYYNHKLAGGKWKYSMCYNPRDLYVFYPPTLPIWLTDQEIEQYTFPESTKSLPLKEVSKDKCIVANACNYTKATDGVIVIQSLGHSMNAVSLPKGKTITFDFESAWEGEAILRTAVIPT
ncbi:MAG: glycosyl hydrolase 115 family protein, partial [Bacteroides sp.]|nr:glycosyl hydrolase 115 family protein [Bacteroides sp.]